MPNSLRGLVYALCHLLADKHFLFPSHWAKDKPLNSKGLYASHCFATTAWPMRLLEHQRYKSSHYSPLLFRRAPHKLQKCCAWFSLWRDHCSESHREQGSCLQERVSGSYWPTEQLQKPLQIQEALKVYCAAFAQFCSPQYLQSGFCQSHGTFELIFNTTVKVTILKVTVWNGDEKWFDSGIKRLKKKDRERDFLGIRDPRESRTED